MGVLRACGVLIADRGGVMQIIAANLVRRFCRSISCCPPRWIARFEGQNWAHGLFSGGEKGAMRDVAV